MSIWKKLSKWADAMEEEAEKGRERKKRRKADRRIQRVVTYVDLLNSFHSHVGDMGRIIDSSCQLLVQRMATFTSDTLTIMAERFVEERQWQAQQFSQQERLFRNSCEQIDGSAEMRNGEVKAMLIAISKQVASADLNNTNRYLELLERIRLAQVAADRNHDVMFGTMLALNEHLLGTLQAKTNEPTLPWLLDNVDSLMALSDALKTLRDNTIPPEMARVKGVTALRSIVDVSSEQASEAVEQLARHWDVAA